jgi:hypothetical protein
MFGGSEAKEAFLAQFNQQQLQAFHHNWCGYAYSQDYLREDRLKEALTSSFASFEQLNLWFMISAIQSQTIAPQNSTETSALWPSQY